MSSSPSSSSPAPHVAVDIPAGVALRHHPLTEISASPGHLLLLKLLHRDEDLQSQRAAFLESRLHSFSRDAFHLALLFLAFHALSLTILFDSAPACRAWQIPTSLSAMTSIVFVACVQGTACARWRVESELRREREAARAMARRVQELRMKGAGFDLGREPQIGRRAKSSSVEVRWRGPLRWVLQNLATVGLICAAGIVAAACKFVACG